MNINEQSTHDVCEMTVPTKQYDARSTKKTFKINSSVAFIKSDDPFLYYSINENRMKTLLGNDAEDEDESPRTESSESSKPNNESSFSVERKTRISFEVHHSLILGDEMFAGDESVGTTSVLDHLFALLDDFEVSEEER